MIKKSYSLRQLLGVVAVLSACAVAMAFVLRTMRAEQSAVHAVWLGGADIIIEDEPVEFVSLGDVALANYAISIERRRSVPKALASALTEVTRCRAMTFKCAPLPSGLLGRL